MIALPWRPIALAAALLCALVSALPACDGCLESESDAPARVESAMEPEWGYGVLRSRYVESFQWSRKLREGRTTATLTLVRETATTGTLQQAMSALLAARESGKDLELSVERRAEITSAALEVMSDPNLGWGADPMLQAAGSYSGQSLTDTLFAALGDDTIRHNAIRSADLLRLGMIECPGTFDEAVAARFRKLPPNPKDGSGSQERVFLAALLLARAADDPKEFGDTSRGWGGLVFDGAATSMAGWDAMSPETRLATMEAAREMAPRQWFWDDTINWIAGHCRERAWMLLELTNPLQEETLISILADKSVESSARLHAALILVYRDPGVLAATRGRDAFCSLVESQSWHVSNLATEMANEGGCEGPERYQESSYLSQELLARPTSSLEARREAHIAIIEELRRRIATETKPSAQIGIWEYLMRAGDAKSRPLIARAAVTNLVADDYYGNAGSAESALQDLGEEGVLAAYAGMNVAADLEDWQLGALCADFIADNDPAFNPGSNLALVELMLKQLEDDSIEGNAAAARRYLLRCGMEIAPQLRELIARVDTQESWKAQDILWGIENRP